MKFRLLLCFSLVFFAASTSAQEYLQMIDAGTYSVQEIIDNAEAHFADMDKGRGTGYKQFKRWEYMANRLQNENGYLTPISERIAELESFNLYLNETAQERAPLNDNWQELGPTDWNQTSGWNPGVGRVTGLDIDQSDSDHMLIGANTGGVWRTTDGGANWTPISDYFSHLYVYSVAIDPVSSSTYYFGSSSGLVFKSTDSGATWNQLADLSGAAVNRILIHPTNPNIIFTCHSTAGIWRTSDGGTNWTQVVTGGGYDVEFKPGDTQTVYAGGNGVFRSTDGGASFTQITGFNSGAKMIGVSADDPTVVYVLDADNNEFGELYRSDDSGVTYTGLGHTNRNYFGYDTAGFGSGGQAPRDMGIAINPSDVDEVHIAGVLMWRSLDGGANFQNVSDWQPGLAASQNKGYHHPDVDDLYWNGTTLYVLSDGGIYKADTPAVTSSTMFDDLTAGLGIRQFYKIGISQTADVVVTGGSQDNGTSVYSQAQGWRDWLGADGMEGYVDKTTTNTMLGTSQFGQLYRSTNGGNSFNSLNEPGPGQGNWVTPMEQDPVAVNTVYLGYNSVYKSTNNGSSWTATSQNFGGFLDEMKVAPSNNQVIYASRAGIMYKTTDGGATNWSTVTNPGGQINNFAIHPTDPDKVAAATTSAGKVYITEDGGATWQAKTLNLPNFSSLAIVWDDNGANGLYLGMDYGIFYIDDTLANWQPYNTNLPNVIINELEINQVDGNIYAGSYGRGLWASPKFDPVLAVQSFLGENAVALFPNPANDKVTIALTEAVEADIRVFDLSGKLVIYQPDVSIEGRHTLNVSALNQGVYFVRLNTNQGSITKKLLKK